MSEYRYPAEVFFSDEDEGFIALAPDLPGCSAFGETAEEALRELQPAIQVWLDAAGKAGNPIPQPSPRKTENLPSGKTLLRLPRTMHKALNERAKLDGISLNSCIVMLLSDALGRESAHREIVAVATRHLREQFTSRSFFRLNALDLSGADLATTRSAGTTGQQILSREGSIAKLRLLPAGEPVICAEE